MGISVFCDGCQKSLNLDERFAGKKVKCKKCGGVLAVPMNAPARPVSAAAKSVPRPVSASAGRPASVPRPAGHRPPPPPPPPQQRDEFDDGPSLDDLASLPEPEVKPLLVPTQPKVYAPNKAGSVAKSVGGGTLKVLKTIFFGKINGKKILGYLLVAYVLIGATVKIYRAYTKISGNDPVGAAIAESTSAKPTGTATIPERPTMGTVAAGIVAGQVNLTNRIGLSTTVKVYLPAGNYAAKSLPVVMIAPAGSMGFTGIPLTADDSPEHLPYVKDGFAVIAYSLSGGFQGDPNYNRKGLKQTAEQFHSAGGGVVDAQDALAYALARFPELNGEFVVAAGHSSAASHALILSYKEPRIKAVAAYSPGLNYVKRLGDDMSVLQRDLPGIRRWLDDYSADKLGTPRCPIMIFHARDDDNTPFSDSEEYANRYPSQVTLEAVRSGGHSEAMLSTGVPAGIRFFRSKVAGLPAKATPLSVTEAPRTVTSPAPPAPAPVAEATPAPQPVEAPIELKQGELQRRGVRVLFEPPPGFVTRPVQENPAVRNFIAKEGDQVVADWSIQITADTFRGDSTWKITDISFSGYRRKRLECVGDTVTVMIMTSCKEGDTARYDAMMAAKDKVRIIYPPK